MTNKQPTKGRKLNPRAQRALDLISDEEDRRITEAALSDPDNPPLTDEDFARMRPAREVVPHIVANPPRKVRGPQKAPKKEQIALSVDPDVLAFFRSTGKGWQTRMNEALRDAMKRLKRAS